MKQRVYKIEEVTENGMKHIKLEKDAPSNLKGKIIILDPEKSEIAQKLDIKEKGGFAVRR